MKKELLLLLLCFSFVSLFSQKDKYCFREYTNIWNGKKISPKYQLIETLKDTNKTQVNKSGDIWSNITNYNFIKDRDNDNGIPISLDSSYVWCKIINITKKTNNYSVRGNRLIKRPIYLIDIECVKEDSIKNITYMRIISISNKKINKQDKKIKIGQTYKLYLVSYFAKDCCKTIMDDKVVDVVMSHSFLNCFIINNIWVVNFALSYNLYKTPNLHGLYYTQADSLTIKP